MSAKLERLCRQLKESFGDRIGEPVINHGEVSVAVPAANYLAVMRQLRDDPAFSFEQLMEGPHGTGAAAAVKQQCAKGGRLRHGCHLSARPDSSMS